MEGTSLKFKCINIQNTVRHALSVNKWFKKQLRTDSDEKLDRRDPNRAEPPPIDNDEDVVAPATDHSYRRGEVEGGHRPLKGGYWFIREKYRDEIAAAIARDKEKWEETKYELEIEERERQFALLRQSRQPEHFQSRHPSPREHFQSRQPSPRERFQPAASLLRENIFSLDNLLQENIFNPGNLHLGRPFALDPLLLFRCFHPDNPLRERLFSQDLLLRELPQQPQPPRPRP